jgi:hypothetical protein
MNSKLIILLLLILFVSVGCSSLTTTPVTQPGMQETNTPMVPSPIITALPSATATVDLDSPAGCINLKPVDFNPAEVNGLLVLEDTANSIVHVLDPKSNQFIDIDKDGHPIFNPNYFLSPNKKYMLVGSPTSDYLVLKTADKEIITNVNTKELDNWLVPRWLDNQHLTFLSAKEPKQDLLVLNPFTGEKRIIHLDLPNANIEVFTPRVRLVYYFIDPTLS